MSRDAPDEKEAPVRALDEDDIALLKTYGLGPYASRIKDVEKDIKSIAQKVNDICGVKESDTGLAPPSRWDVVSDKQTMQEEQPLQVRSNTPVGLDASEVVGFHPVRVWICTCVSMKRSSLVVRCPKLNVDLHVKFYVLQVARCTKIIKPGTEETKYVINVKQIAKVPHPSSCS